MEGDEPREASVGEGQALHEEALLVPVEARHLVRHLVLAEHVPVGLAGVRGAWRGQNGLARGPREQEGARNLPDTMEATRPPPLLTSHSQRRERGLTPRVGRSRVGQGGHSFPRPALRSLKRATGWHLAKMFTPNQKVRVWVGVLPIKCK